MSKLGPSACNVHRNNTKSSVECDLKLSVKYSLLGGDFSELGLVLPNRLSSLATPSLRLLVLVWCLVHVCPTGAL